MGDGQEMFKIVGGKTDMVMKDDILLGTPVYSYNTSLDCLLKQIFDTL